MNIINIFLNFKEELTFNAGVGVSTAGLWLSLLWPEEGLVTPFSIDSQLLLPSVS